MTDTTRARNDPGRDETEAQRDDRNLAELLQELRVAGLGVQVLFGFLLSLPFTNRFVKLSHSEVDLYVVALLLAAISTALLVAPVAYHRLVFREHEKGRLSASPPLRSSSASPDFGFCSLRSRRATFDHRILSRPSPCGNGEVTPSQRREHSQHRMRDPMLRMSCDYWLSRVINS